MEWPPKEKLYQWPPDPIENPPLIPAVSIVITVSERPDKERKKALKTALSALGMQAISFGDDADDTTTLIRGYLPEGNVPQLEHFAEEQPNQMIVHSNHSDFPLLKPRSSGYVRQ